MDHVALMALLAHLVKTAYPVDQARVAPLADPEYLLCSGLKCIMGVVVNMAMVAVSHILGKLHKKHSPIFNVLRV